MSYIFEVFGSVLIEYAIMRKTRDELKSENLKFNCGWVIFELILGVFHLGASKFQS